MAQLNSTINLEGMKVLTLMPYMEWISELTFGTDV